MGLDVTLIEYDDYEATKEAMRLVQAEITQDLPWDAQAAIYHKYGLTEYGEDTERSRYIELPSAKYPEHLYKIGYWRSSYNAGGMNHVLESADIESLYDLFPERDTDKEYDFVPSLLEWQVAKATAVVMLSEFQEQHKKNRGLVVREFSHNMFSELEKYTDQQVLDAYLKDWPYKFSGESRDTLHFMAKDAPKVYGMCFCKSYFDKPAVKYIVKSDLTFYFQALEIVEETCDWVLARFDSGKTYGMSWSG